MQFEPVQYNISLTNCKHSSLWKRTIEKWLTLWGCTFTLPHIKFNVLPLQCSALRQHLSSLKVFTQWREMALINPSCWNWGSSVSEGFCCRYTLYRISSRSAACTVLSVCWLTNVHWPEHTGRTSFHRCDAKRRRLPRRSQQSFGQQQADWNQTL